jgi:hypothetical protein
MISKGEFKKKPKNNNSYYKRFQGEFVDGVPHGKDGVLEIKLSAWPRYHLIVSKFGSIKDCCGRKRNIRGENQSKKIKSVHYKRSVKYQGEFVQG